MEFNFTCLFLLCLFLLPDSKPRADKTPEIRAAQPHLSPEMKIDDEEEDDLDIMNDDEDDGNAAADGGTIEVKELDFDINIPHQNDTDEEIGEIDIDVSGDEADKRPNDAEALGAEVDAQARDGQTSSSGSSSGSSSSDDSSSSSGSDNNDSSDGDADSVTSI